jgi:hypothetical protein
LPPHPEQSKLPPQPEIALPSTQKRSHGGQRGVIIVGKISRAPCKIVIKGAESESERPVNIECVVGEVKVAVMMEPETTVMFQYVDKVDARNSINSLSDIVVFSKSYPMKTNPK